MSPRRLDPSIVEARLTAMTELLDDLAGVDTTRLAADRLLRHAVERILTQLVELAAAVNEHVAGARLDRAATSYRDSFVLAAESGMVDEALRDALIRSVGLRNVLVHEYVAVDLAQVRAEVPLALDVYRRYVAQAAASVVDGSVDGSVDGGTVDGGV